MVYTLIYQSDGIIRDSDGATIPNSNNNIDWQAYQSWLAANNTPNSAVVPPVQVPSSVALWQAKAALQAAGLLTAADTAIAAANNPVLNQFWSSAATIDRTSPTLISLGQALNISNTQIDALFIQAESITL